MTRKLCAAPGCEDIALSGKARCNHHQAEANARQSEQRAAAKLSQAAQAGSKLYRSARWQKAARKHLDRHPLCVDCGDLGAIISASEVDHIKPHRGNAQLFWDRSSWQSLCKPCHSRKTAREVFGGRGRG